MKLNENLKRKLEDDIEKLPKKPKVEISNNSTAQMKPNETKVDPKKIIDNLKIDQLSNRDKRMKKRNDIKIYEKISDEIEIVGSEIKYPFFNSLLNSLKDITYPEKLKKLNCTEKISIYDGDCGFFSFLKLLNLNISTFDLRTMIVNYYKENLHLLRNKLNELRDNHRTYPIQNNEDYLKIMSKERVWMTNLEIHCISRMFMKNILVLDQRQNCDSYYVGNTESPSFLILSFNGTNHWSYCTLNDVNPN